MERWLQPALGARDFNPSQCRAQHFQQNKSVYVKTTGIEFGKFKVLMKRKMRRPYKPLDDFSGQTQSPRRLGELFSERAKAVFCFVPLCLCG